MSEWVMAVDPGVTTGWATWYDNRIWFTAEDDQQTFLSGAEALLNSASVTVVCERYIISAETVRKTRQSASLEIIGALRYFTSKHDLPFVLQKSTDAMNFATDDKLAKLGWIRPKKLVHANDALRHLCLYLCKSGNRQVLDGLR